MEAKNTELCLRLRILFVSFCGSFLSKKNVCNSFIGFARKTPHSRGIKNGRRDGVRFLY